MTTGHKVNDGARAAVLCRCLGVLRTAVLCGLALAGAASAAELRVTVTDASGRPLTHTAVLATWPGAAPPQTGAQPAVMMQRDMQFVPHMLIVPLGAEVVFPNEDKTRHHVYSFSQARTFDIELYIGRSDGAISFNQPGVVTLGCNIHDHMQGYIVVSAHPRWAVTDAAGRATLEDLPEAPVTLVLWHPWMTSETMRERRVLDPGVHDVAIILDVSAPPQPAAPDTPSLQDRFDRLAQ